MSQLVHRAWWGCHWCNWEAPVRRRLFDRWRATREFRRHLLDKHPGVIYDNQALWGRGGRPKRTSIIWCPQCARDLNGDDHSYIGTAGEWLEVYRCASCGERSDWDFDAPVPLLIWRSHGHPVRLDDVGRR